MDENRRKALAAALDQLKAIPASEGRVVVATGRFVGEGCDDARLDTLFLTMPVSWRGTVAQYAGRLHRLYEGKKVVQVHDFADLDVPMLSRMFDKRCAGYEAIGYTILLPASALPRLALTLARSASASAPGDFSIARQEVIAASPSPLRAREPRHRTS